jgi:hypothetical protein
VTGNYAPSSETDVWEAENVFYLKSHPSRLAKLLAHYEIYRNIASVPGAVVECGVYKGASLTRFATFRALLENNDSRKIYGFDAFGAFPTTGVQSQADQSFIGKFEEQGGAGISSESLGRLLRAKGFANFDLIKGDVFDTIPALIRTSPYLRIALLHLDMDVYEPTRFAVDQLLPHMAPGGLIVFDDYNSVEGATRVADELCRSHGWPLEKNPFYNVPSFVRVRTPSSG